MSVTSMAIQAFSHECPYGFQGQLGRLVNVFVPYFLTNRMRVTMYLSDKTVKNNGMEKKNNVMESA